MQMIWLLLTFMPLAMRCTVDSTCTPYTFFISCIPLFVLFPSSLVHMYVRDIAKEHLLRHILYTCVFFTGLVTLDWDVIRANIHEQWCKELIVYLALGGFTLTFFCISHAIEIWPGTQKIHTHYGDVVTLPLTLIATTIVLENTPMEAFVLSRSVFVYVPIIVGWGTIFLIAFANFATNNDTRHSCENFTKITHLGYVIAFVQLFIYEFEASNMYFFSFPFISAIFIQCVQMNSIVLQKNCVQRYILASLVGSLFGFFVNLYMVYYLKMKSALDGTYCAGFSLAFIIGQEVGISNIGALWVVPISGLASFVSLSYFEYIYEIDVKFVLFIIGQFLLGFFLLSCINHELYLPKLPSPPNGYNPPQLIKKYFFSRLVKYTKTVIRSDKTKQYKDLDWYKLFDNIHPHCPSELNGVWWMKDNTMPMHLICMHHLDLSQFMTTFDNCENTARHSTVSGYVSYVTSLFAKTRIIKRSDHWMQTDVYFELFGLTFFFDTLWIYKTRNENKLHRLAYDKKGNIVYHYKLLKIAYKKHGVIHKTPYYSSFMNEHGNTSYVM